MFLDRSTSVFRFFTNKWKLVRLLTISISFICILVVSQINTGTYERMITKTIQQTNILNEKPNLLIVQGDTTTVAICALMAFYQKIPIGHIEAGLRTYDLDSPYPEEGNRQIVSRIATYNWAPTKLAEKQLNHEKVKNIIFTGNTIVDACTNFNVSISYNNQILITFKGQIYL